MLGKKRFGHSFLSDYRVVFGSVNYVFWYHLNLFSLLLIVASYAYEKYLIRVLRIMGVS